MGEGFVWCSDSAGNLKSVTPDPDSQQTMEEALKHLGAVLYVLADLHPDDRCQALNEALEFYNRECPHEQIAPTEGYVSYLVTVTPIDAALGRTTACISTEHDAGRTTSTSGFGVPSPRA